MPSILKVNLMDDYILQVENLRKWYPVRRGFLASLLSKEELYIKAVDGVSFKVRRKEIFGLIGESGCGKTTLGKTVIRLYEPTAGKILFNGVNLTALEERELKEMRKKMQIIYQDPYESLNPRMSVYDIVSEPLKVHRITGDPEEEEEIVRATLEKVELRPADEFMYRYPHELSGGQRQRVAIARAIVLNPIFLVADEPVSMLDVSIRSGILRLMLDLRGKYDITYLFITHDLAIARNIADRGMIMYLGKMAELGTMDQIVENPQHPYTKALIAAVPVPDPTAERTKVVIGGEVPSPINPPPGCRFRKRCPHAMEICGKKDPEPVEVEKGHYVSCFLYK